MALRIDNNLAAQNTQRQLAGTQAKQAKSLEKLATGKQVNGGQDDAVVLAISSKVGGNIRALHQSMRNANDGITLSKVGDSALADMASMFQRMQELSSQKGNATLGGEDQAAIDGEITALQGEINNLQSTTQFNGKNLFTGLNQAFTVGENDTFTLSMDPLNVDVGNNVPDVDAAMENISAARAQFGQAADALASRATDSAVRAENLAAAKSQLMDADIAAEMAQLTRTTILQRAGVTVQTQANLTSTSAMSLLKD